MRTPLLFAAIAAIALSGAAEAQTLRAEIRRTAYGVPHIRAQNLAGLGYGAGYVSAEDNFCEFAERMLTVNGERARWLGAGERDANVLSDLYHQALIASGRMEALLNGPAGSIDTPTADARAMARGFIAGVNRYVRDVGAANLPDARCRGAPWIRTYREADYWRSAFAGQSPTLMAGVAGAAPPGVPDLAPPPAPAQPGPTPEGQGSNAYALGGEATRSGRGVLLGNPHYPWDGINRFYRMHYVIPGRLNVVGAGLMNSPSIGIGHNEHFAWTHTVSTARRYGLFELTLDPKDPTAYVLDGRSVPMERREITVQVKTDQGLRPVTRTLYWTRFGPLVETATYPWGAERAFAVRSAPTNLRSLDQYIRMWRARSVRELAAILSRHQAAGFNTTAVDASGEAFYGDIGALPYVTDEKVAACATSEIAQKTWKADRIPVLDGSRAACDWDSDPAAAAAGIFPPQRLPQIFRRDFTSNSNDSYWLTNPAQPLTGYPRIFGEETTARSLRTRLSLKQIEDRLAGRDGLGPPKFDLKSVQDVLYANRNLGAEMARDDLVGLCRRQAQAGAAQLAAACEALAGWDLKVNLDSRGAQVFRLFADKGGLKWKVPFDPADPLNTPHTLDVDDPAVLKALTEAVAELARLGLAPDAPLAAVQTEPRGDERIPIHGGPGTEGIFNVITPVQLRPQLGWTKIVHGSSWIMTVEFTERGPVSQGVLTYSQSTNPASPHVGDQTRAYSQKVWDDLRFDWAAVEAGTVSRKTIEEPGR